MNVRTLGVSIGHIFVMEMVHLELRIRHDLSDRLLGGVQTDVSCGSVHPKGYSDP